MQLLICRICRKEESIRKDGKLLYDEKCTKCIRQNVIEMHPDIFGKINFLEFSDQDYIKLGQICFSIIVQDAGRVVRDFYKTGEREYIDRILGDFLDGNKKLFEST